MSDKSLQKQIDDIKKAIEAQEGMRPILGDAVVGTTLAVLHDQLHQLERQAGQQDAANQTRRKLVTVLFADVPGFTEFSEHRDAEDVATLINRLWTRADWIIQEYGGRIDKHIGDAVMALWGAETAREDDAERAVRAALQIQEMFKDGVGTLPISLKVGINSGQVLLSTIGTQGEFTAMGDTVNTASRLVHAADGGDVLISHNTYQLVRGVFDVQKQTPLMVKGKTEPLQTYVVQRVKPRSFQRRRRGVEGVTTRMVGRKAEFQAIQSAFEQCVASGHVTVVVVKGDAGLGKSRLIYEFEAWLESHPSQSYIFKGRADEETMSLPYSLLRDIFCERFQIRDSDTQAEAREKVVKGMAAMTEAGTEERASLIGELLGFDFSESPFVRGIRKDARQIRDRSFNSIVQIFTELTLDAPVVILLDDMQWADNGSLDLIEHLAKLETHLPVLILCAARPGLEEAHPSWGSNFPLCTRITIAGLDLAASRELVGEILQKVPDLPRDLVETVARNADGNPFYLEELIKVLIEDGVIVKGETAWRIVPRQVTKLRVPATLTGVLQARLDRLPSAESEVLERAAVIGRTFWDEAVAAIQGSEAAQAIAGGEEVHSALVALRNKELVFSHQPSTFARAREFIFKHAILRDVTYERVLKAKRKLYHRMAADWLIQQSSERIDEYLGLIAQHYELAGDTGQAIHFLARAADRSVSLGAYREALSSAERAFGLLSSDHANPGMRARLLLTIGTAHLWLTEHGTATTRFEECITLARGLHDRRLEARALAHLGRIGLEQGKFEQAESYLKRSYDIVRELHDTEMMAYTLTHLGYISHYQGRYGDAQHYGEQSYELAKQSGDAIAQALALNMLAMISVNTRRFEQSHAYYLQAIEICKQAGDRYGLARAYNNLSELLRIQRKYAEAKPYTLEAIRLARELGNRYVLPIMLINLVHSQVGLGELREAYASLRAALQLNTESNSVSWVLFSLVGYAHILAAEGRRQPALQILGLCSHHPETNSDTQRDIQLVLEDLRGVRSDDIETDLEGGKRLELNKIVLMALGA